MTGSNRRHPPCKGGALPAELIALACSGSLRRSSSLACRRRRRFSGGSSPGKFKRDRDPVKTHYHADYPSEITNVALARRSVAGFASACGFSESEIADIRLAAGEALSNAVEHGSRTSSAGFTVDCSFDGHEIRIEIQDSGTGFCAPGIQGNVITPDHRGRGFGIFLMRRLMDDVAFGRNGTIVRLTRRQRRGYER